MVQHTNAGDNMDLSLNVCTASVLQSVLNTVCVHAHDMCIAVWKYKMTSWDNFKFYYEV